MRASTPAHAAAIHFEVVTDRRELAGLRADWDALFAGRDHQPSASWEWTQAALAHHRQRDDALFLIRGVRAGAAVALVPLVLRRVHVMRQPVTLLAPLTDEYNTHSDWLLAEPSAAVVDGVLDTLLALEASWDCFRMARLLEDDPLTATLRDALTRRRLLHHDRRGDPSYFLALPASYGAYLSARSSKFRNYLKRIERKLESLGRVAVHELTSTGDFDAAYEQLLDIERASWKQNHGTAVTAVPRQIGFYRDLGRDALARGRLHLQWLTLDGRPIAHNFGYVHAGTYFYLKTSFDETLKSVSPATYLRARLIDGLIGRGVGQFDFPGAPYEWERQWTDTVRWHRVVTLFSGTVRSRALEFVERLRHAVPPPAAVCHQDARAQKAPEAGS